MSTTTLSLSSPPPPSIPHRRHLTLPSSSAAFPRRNTRLRGISVDSPFTPAGGGGMSGSGAARGGGWGFDEWGFGDVFGIGVFSYFRGLYIERLVLGSKMRVRRPIAAVKFSSLRLSKKN